MHFVLFYEFVDDYLERRVPLRSEHLALLEAAHERGDLVMAGAYADPADGAALVFKGEDDGAARSFVENDPYVRQGLVTKWHVRRWTVVVGDV